MGRQPSTQDKGYKMRNSFFWELMGTKGMARVIDTLIDNHPIRIDKQTIIESTGMSERTVRDCLYKLAKAEIIIVTTEKYDKKWYMLDNKNHIARVMKKLDTELTEAGTEEYFSV